VYFLNPLGWKVRYKKTHYSVGIIIDLEIIILLCVRRHLSVSGATSTSAVWADKWQLTKSHILVCEQTDVDTSADIRHYVSPYIVVVCVPTSDRVWDDNCLLSIFIIYTKALGKLLVPTNHPWFHWTFVLVAIVFVHVTTLTHVFT